MEITLLSCDAQRPDRRAIVKMLEEFAGMSRSEATECTNNLLDGSSIDVQVTSASTSSAFRALRKLDIDYEIIE